MAMSLKRACLHVCFATLNHQRSNLGNWGTPGHVAGKLYCNVIFALVVFSVELEATSTQLTFGVMGLTSREAWELAVGIRIVRVSGTTMDHQQWQTRLVQAMGTAMANVQ